MAIKAKNKLEVLWQDFEKSGSISAYLTYHQSKQKPEKASLAKPKERVKSKR